MTSNFSNILRDSIFSNYTYIYIHIHTKMANVYMIQLVCQVKYVYNFFYLAKLKNKRPKYWHTKQSENSYSAVNMTNIFSQILFDIIIE